MGSSVKNFVRVSMILSLALLMESILRVPALASQDSTEAAIFDQALKEAAQEQKQQKKIQAQSQKQLLRKQRAGTQFESLLAKARQQHATINEWQKKNSRQWKVYATKIRNKRHLLVANTISR